MSTVACCCGALAWMKTESNILSSLKNSGVLRSFLARRGGPFLSVHLAIRFSIAPTRRSCGNCALRIQRATSTARRQPPFMHRDATESEPKPKPEIEIESEIEIEYRKSKVEIPNRT